MSGSLDNWMAERDRMTAEREREESQEHFADPEATIPDLDFSTPDCPICGHNTEYDEGFRCDVCDVWWPMSGYGSHAERTVEATQ